MSKKIESKEGMTTEEFENSLVEQVWEEMETTFEYFDGTPQVQAEMSFLKVLADNDYFIENVNYRLGAASVEGTSGDFIDCICSYSTDNNTGEVENVLLTLCIFSTKEEKYSDTNLLVFDNTDCLEEEESEE